MTEINKIFVYGTLRKKSFVREWGVDVVDRCAGEIAGEMYYPVGCVFPVVIVDEETSVNRAKGSLITIRNIDEILPIWDRFESEGVFYHRKVVGVHTDSGTERAYAYIGNRAFWECGKFHSNPQLIGIPSGDWVVFLKSHGVDVSGYE